MPCLEIMKAVTDKNITSGDSKIRVNAFKEADILSNPKNKDVELVLEGNLFEKLSLRLNEEHVKIMRGVYEVEDSALGTPTYNITKSIKFIAEEKKFKLNPKNRVIIITENVSDYSEFQPHTHILAITPKEFMVRIERFNKLKVEYDTIHGAMVTAFFIK